MRHLVFDENHSSVHCMFNVCINDTLFAIGKISKSLPVPENETMIMVLLDRIDNMLITNRLNQLSNDEIFYLRMVYE